MIKWTKDMMQDQLNGLHTTLALSFNRAWDAYDYNRTWWRDAGLDDLFHNVWSKGIDEMQQAKMLAEQHINDGNINELHNDALLLKSLGRKFDEAAKRFYAHESCWNPQLPQTMTRVLGHTYTNTEWVRQQAWHLSGSLSAVGDNLLEACKNAVAA